MLCLFAAEAAHDDRASNASAACLAEEHPGRIHFAIAAPTAEAVTEYHQAAQTVGGKDNGAPGHRAHYPEGGVGTFVIDPWNNNIEVAYRP
jgi:hypothetical protein